MDQKKEETVVEKAEEIKVSEGVQWKELKQDIGEERDVSLHETEISVAEDTSIKDVELGKEAETEEDVTKAVLDDTEEKDILVHETEISVASIPVEERKEEAISMSRKHERELEDVQADVKYHKIHHTKKAKTEDEGETILPEKELEQKR